jgi:hypothetical protein
MFGLTTTRRLRAELAAAKAETDRQRDRAERAEEGKATAEFNREQILRQLAAADAANRRLHDRNLELGSRISALTEADPEYTARLERRVARLLRVAVRLYAGGHAEKLRADHLQQRLDDACGLNAPAVLAGSGWQTTRHDKKTRTAP